MIDLESVPDSPGCYMYKDSTGKIIYIGKAKDLKKRVKSYFQRDVDSKTEALLKNVSSFDFIATNNELEALILENKLIKQHQPKYNINLKDSKTYAYIEVTDETYPRLLVVRNKEGSGRFFGPFVSAEQRDYIVKLLRKVFKVRTCRKLLKRACLKYHINLCSAPCIGNISVEDYNNSIKSASKVLTGDINGLISELNKKIESCKESKDYEKAIILRDQVSALNCLLTKQNVEREKKYDEDVINYKVLGDKVYLILFNVNKGVLSSKAEYVFNYTNEFFTDFLIQYYADYPVPRELIVPEQIEHSIVEYLEKMRNSRVTVTVPKFGEKKELLDLVSKNLELTYFGSEMKLTALKEELKLPLLPTVVECFDISHLAGTLIVGAMVSFKNSKPDKSNYRRFKIKTISKADDTSAIKEVVARRYSRLLKENKPMPDLIVIDGGRGQLNAAKKALNELRIDLPIISIAKGDEEIYSLNLKSPVRLDKKGAALKYVMEVRDEAHRFAVNYNKILRSKKLKG
jgi:excinuclease ABC subunit C